MTYPKPGEVAFKTDSGEIDVQEFDHVDVQEAYVRVQPTVKDLEEVAEGESHTPIIQYFPWHRIHNVTRDYRDDD